MGRRGVVCCLVVVASAATLNVASAPSRQATKFKHPGMIIDYESAKPIPAASAKAYASDATIRVGGIDCPRYTTETLDSKESTDKGTFTFEIDTSRPTYLAAYCKKDYFFVEVPDNSNATDGTLTGSYPVSLRSRRERK